MRRKPPRYPRRTVRIAIEHLLRRPTAISDRAEQDKVIILRAGKPCLVILRHDHYAMLVRRANETRHLTKRRLGSGVLRQKPNFRYRLP